MTTAQIKFQTTDGNEVTIDPKVVNAYYARAAAQLKAARDAADEFKAIVETVSETTGLAKKHVSKYFKAKFKSATKVDKDIGELFATLDDALSGKKPDGNEG